MMKSKKMNQMCSKHTKKCNECNVYSCKKQLLKLETNTSEIEYKQIEEIKRQLPVKCQRCKLYKIIDTKNKKVYCSYMIGNCCSLDRNTL